MIYLSTNSLLPSHMYPSNTIPSNMPCSVKLHALDNGVVSPV